MLVNMLLAYFMGLTQPSMGMTYLAMNIGLLIDKYSMFSF